MKRVMALIGCLALVATMAVPVFAQAPATPSDPHRHDAPAPSAPAPAGPQGPGAAGGTMSMEMCRQMMGGPMMGAMMEPPANQPMDPKMMGHMMEMRGEMMKAMGEVMMKHARRMNGAGPGRSR